MLFRVAAQISSALQRVEEFLVSASILAIAALTILNVVCRSLLGFSLAAAEEVSQFCIIAVCFVGLSYAAGKGRHIRMTALYDQFPPALRKRCMIVITGATSAILLALAWCAARYVAAVYQLGGISPALRAPYFAVYAIAPVGLFLAGVQYGLAMLRNLTEPGIYLSPEVKAEDEEPLTQEI